MYSSNELILVSVIIPYFKKKDYIEETLKSVLSQTYQNFEIIIIYDDQDKNDLEYLNKIYKNEKRIKFYSNSENIGAGLSRNKGIDLANGKYVAFIDADDVWKTEKLESQIRFMTKNNLDFTHTSYEIIDKKNQILGKRIARNFLKTEDLIKSCDIGLSTVIISRSVFDKETRFPNLKTKEDFVLWLKILEKKIQIGSVDKILTSWRKLDGSLSSSIKQKLIDAFQVYSFYMGFNKIKSIYYVFCLSINSLKK
jgi:teichuronic acid biosynthesis glycosyltransferase TuaG